MARAAAWFLSVTIGCSAVAAQPALGNPPEGKPRLASAAPTSAEDLGAQYIADYVNDLPAESEPPGPPLLPDAIHSGDVAVPSDDAMAEDGTEVINERYPDGRVMIERQVTQDASGNYVNHGTWKKWDERGRLVAQGTYAQGKRHGEWIRWYRSPSEAGLLGKAPYTQFAGPYVSQATFKHDQLDGAWTIYDGKLHKINQWHFAAGKRHGKSTWWHPGGRPLREATFVDGVLDGKLVEWAPDGSQRSSDTYYMGRKLGVKTTTYPGGQRKSQAQMLFAKQVEATPDDWWNGTLQTTSSTGGDERHGPWISWYVGGQKQMEGAFEHDLQVGAFSWWHPNGQKALEGNFAAGKQNGQWSWWYANGQKSIQGAYVNGNPTGRWTWWREDGKIAQAADLSGSEGVVLEAPRTLGPGAGPRIGRPIPLPMQPQRR